ncbi:MAG: FAD-dependent oxidoreductase [Pseudomonadota bacterium]
MTSIAAYDLCVIGAGIAGLNALFVAKKYLPASARVALIDRNERPGGMWNTTYDYVRLHQPHPMFTAGNIPWPLSKPRDYLATGHEVQSHLQHCLGVIEDGLHVDKFWSSDVIAVDEFESDDGPFASVTMTPTGEDGTDQQLHSKRVIFAKGLNVPEIRPLTFSSSKVESCMPETLSKYFETDAPVYVVGGGKTGMDTVLELGSSPGSREISLIVGKGTLFNKRDMFFPTGLKRYLNPNSNLKMAVDIAMRFDGNNGDYVFDHFKENYTITPGGRGERFMFGLLSEDECDRIEQLTDEFIYDYLEDVIDTDHGPAIVLRSGSRKPVKPGSVFINCTGHLFKGVDPRVMLLSEHSTILNLTSRASFHFLPAMSSYFLSHLFFSDKLKNGPYSIMDTDALLASNKKDAFIVGITQALLNSLLALDDLSLKVFNEFGLDFDLWHPIHKRLAGLVNLQINRKKYIDHCQRTLATIGELNDAPNSLRGHAE